MPPPPDPRLVARAARESASAADAREDTWAPGRVVAFDWGAARTGVAATDEERRLATPRGEIPPPGRDGGAALRRTLGELSPVAVVVGLPLHMNGAPGASAEAAFAFVDRVRELVRVPVLMYDERLTSAGARRTGTGATGENARAAAVLLTDFLTFLRRSR